MVQGRLDFKTPEVYDFFKQKTTKIWIKIKLFLQNKISRAIPLYIEQGRLDLETLEVLKVLKQETTIQKQCSLENKNFARDRPYFDTETPNF